MKPTFISWSTERVQKVKKKKDLVPFVWATLSDIFFSYRRSRIRVGFVQWGSILSPVLFKMYIRLLNSRELWKWISSICTWQPSLHFITQTSRCVCPESKLVLWGCGLVAKAEQVESESRQERWCWPVSSPISPCTNCSPQAATYWWFLHLRQECQA